MNSEGESSKSEIVMIIYLNPADAPSKPLMLTASLIINGGNIAINLSWTIPSSENGSPITSYNIYRDNELLNTNSASILTYLDENVINGEEYVYHVTANNQIGESENSEQVTIIATDSSGFSIEFGTIQIVLISVGIFLVVSSIFVIIKLRKKPEIDFKNLKL